MPTPREIELERLLDTAIAERDQLKADLEKREKWLHDSEAAKTRYLADAKRMREALKKYGTHQDAPCADYMGNTGKPCECGLDAALSAPTEKPDANRTGE